MFGGRKHSFWTLSFLNWQRAKVLLKLEFDTEDQVLFDLIIQLGPLNTNENPVFICWRIAWMMIVKAYFQVWITLELANNLRSSCNFFCFLLIVLTLLTCRIHNLRFFAALTLLNPTYFGSSKPRGGGAKRHPLEINKGAPWDLMLLKAILKPIKVMITCKKLAPYLKIPMRYWYLKIWRQ